MVQTLTVPGNSCQVHRYHWPRPARTIKHHIKPQEYGGKTVPENLVLVCDTGHYTIHEYLNSLLAGVYYSRKITKKEKALAIQGFNAILADRPGSPT